MPHYKKAFDIGTYTGNGGQLRIGIPTLRGVGPTGTQVAGSVRFRSGNNNYLSKTPGSSTSSKQYTVSVWVKRSLLASGYSIFGARNTAPSATQAYFPSSDVLRWYEGGADYQTTIAFRDTIVWNHIVFSFDSSQSTATDRMKIYLNGKLLDSYGTRTTPSLNQSPIWNTNCSLIIGGIYEVSAGSLLYPFDGYLSQFYNIDGQALTASSFGEFNSDGIWVPKAYSGTYGTNGFYLPMNSSSNYATDQSGNGNNWTPSGFNITTANTTYDIMTDSPTDYLSGSMSTANNAGNYCTQNPLLKGANVTLSDGNLKAVMANASDCSFGGTTKITSGKWYWEVKITTPSTDYPYIGVATPVFDYTAVGASCIRSSSTGFFKASNATKWNSSSSAYGSSFAAGDTMQIAFDADNGKIYFGKNGTWDASSDPATAANPAFTGISTPVVPAGFASNCTWETNFGQRPFAYTPPTGFTSLNTYNYPRPADSSMWFYGDTPDLMWIKNRGVGGSNVLQDTVRGINFALFSNTDGVDQGYPYVMEMNKFGMSLQLGTGVNAAGVNFVYWAWKAGSNTSSTSVTNTDGTITSQVSANRQAGFSIVSYTGTGANGTVGHGLGTAPSMIICKRRVTTAGDWQTYHISVGNTGTLKLNSTAATITASVVWNNTSPTSSVFSLGSGGDANLSGDPFIAYCWAPIPGYSAFGSYAGNGVSDGPFVYTGFSPRWLMVKSITAASASNWCIYDVVRQTYNQLRNPLYANANSQEPTAGIAFDIVSNGFKLREGGGQGNDSGVTYIYAAFAETPFKFARAR